MKVLHVLNELKPSGAETMLRCAAPHWKSHGVGCDILATGANEGPFADALREVGYAIHHLPREPSLGYFRNFRKLVRANGYDVVHQHAEGASYWFALAAMSAGARVVRTIHNNFSFEGSLRWRRSLQRRHLAFQGVRHVSIAPGVQHNERKRFGLRSELVLNWVDTSRFSPISAPERHAARQKWGFAEDSPVLISLGNCSTVKNHGLVLEAMARLHDFPQLHYLHVGLEGEAGGAERQLANRLGIADRVVFAGWLPNVREALAAADLYVMPSLYEGLGIAALEALGMGLPAVLARADGLSDLGPMFDGLMFAELEPESWAAAIRSFFLLDHDARIQLAADYPAIVSERFGPQRGVREYCSIYQP
jgi:glycosyltransferase involved in cell wall biosynthesis